ncbi:hypothetical protein Q9L58_002321 [Maublancomyces gigas]|uniref:Spindle pole body component n=1 Tax=Discina gigas TaxID=1032678 RepID=A0ABR3GRT4_9PEZI
MPPNRAILASLSTLGHLHISLRNACSQITTTHSSTIARAVASGIDTHHLHSFRSRILAVERSVLQRDAAMVGGYDIVSLALILGSFEGWERVLRYLHDLAESILSTPDAPEGKHTRSGRSRSITGAELINRLRADIYTGFPTLEAVALHLLEVAETAWLREVSTWVLYGRLPSSSSFGSSSASADFFITEDESEVQNPGGEEEIGVLKEYTVTKRLLPEFVTSETASSILFIGRALSIIRLRGGSAANSEGSYVASPEMTLLPVHLSHLRLLQSPLSPHKLLNAISEIRLSLSRHTLQTLLPASKIIDVVHVLREFFLLGRGEFAVALIEQSSEQVRNRWRRPGAGGGVGASWVKSATGALVKEGEVSAILTRTWGVLSSLQGEEAHDERLDTARDLLYLTLNATTTAAPGTPTESFKDLLVGVPVTLNFHLSWPLELFLQPADLELYDALFAYLVSVRRTQIRLQGLWRSRRPAVPRAKKGPGARNHREMLKRREQRERTVWATASLAVFFLETIVEYWQGEVVVGAFADLTAVLGAGTGTDDSGADNDDSEDDVWASTEPRPVAQEDLVKQQDPESLMRAHHLYLSRLKRGLFMADPVFAPLLRRFLTTADSLVAAIDAVARRHEVADLQSEGAEGAGEMVQCEEVRTVLAKLVQRLQRMDEERDFFSGVGAEAEREGGKIDRLLMRLDLGYLVGEG